MNQPVKSEDREIFWRNQVDAWEKSGQNKKAFCSTHDLNYHRFKYWQKKLTAQKSSGTDTGLHNGFVKVSAPTPAPLSALSLSFGDGWVVNGIDESNLDIVCKLVRGLP